MNKITPSSILVEHTIKDKDGSVYPGFYGIFSKENQNEPDVTQRLMLDGYTKAGYVTYFGPIKEMVNRLNEYVR